MISIVLYISIILCRFTVPGKRLSYFFAPFTKSKTDMRYELKSIFFIQTMFYLSTKIAQTMFNYYLLIIFFLNHTVKPLGIHQGCCNNAM